VGRERLRQRGGKRVRALHAKPERSDVLGDACEVYFAIGPQLARLLGLLAAIGAVEAALGLITAAVVVDDRDAVDTPAYRRLDFADVIPESGVAGEYDHRPLRARAFRAHAGGKCPAQMAGAPHVA